MIKTSRTNKCLICKKDITSSTQHILATDMICKYCIKKFSYLYKTVKIDNVSCLFLYEYNDFMRNLILNVKARYDISLAKAILLPVKDYLRCHYMNYSLIPIPSSNKDDKKRSFNHVVEIIKPLNLPILNAFYKDSVYKQSSQDKFHRINIKNILKVKKELLNHNKKYLIVDDISTTHQTIKQAIRLLKQNNINNIKVLIIASKRRNIYEKG